MNGTALLLLTQMQRWQQENVIKRIDVDTSANKVCVNYQSLRNVWWGS